MYYKWYKDIYTSPNSLIVHGALRLDHKKAKRKREKRKKFLYLYIGIKQFTF